jgi:hypothetical protein
LTDYLSIGRKPYVQYERYGVRGPGPPFHGNSSLILKSID